MLRWTWTLVEHARPHELSRARSHSGESSGSGASVSAAAESGTCRLSIRPFGMCSVRASHGFTNTVQFTQSVGLVSVR